MINLHTTDYNYKIQITKYIGLLFGLNFQNLNKITKTDLHKLQVNDFLQVS